jgi:hypothetical protein
MYEEIKNGSKVSVAFFSIYILRRMIFVGLAFFVQT